MSDWHVAHIGFENDAVVIDGVNVWKHKWRSTHKRVELPHPAYPEQMHNYTIWEVKPFAHRTVRFAACELSGGVYGFYVRD